MVKISKISKIEIAIARRLGVRNNTIIPNLSWGLPGLNHEMDLICVNKAGFVTEVEIKRSLADLKADNKKLHKHIDYYNRIKYLYFAIPLHLLEKSIEHIPKEAGIITFDSNLNTKYERLSKPNLNAKRLTLEELVALGRLASIRIWNLKQKIEDIKIEYQNTLF